MDILTEENYIEILDNHFADDKTVICFISTSQSCENCKITIDNMMEFMGKNPESKLTFCYVNYAKHDILQNYKELSPMVEYPKSVVFYADWHVREFYEGALSMQDLMNIDSKSK